MKSSVIRQRFLTFFEKRGHSIIPSASLIPENDPSVLFNTAGMQPLVPYLLGEPHPMGKRIVDIQKCVRTGDLNDIGDNRHFSFFEMMGNWSLGDYFKKEAISWSYEFLTSEKEGLGLDPKRLYVTIFEGDINAPYDQESKDVWMSVGIPESRIYALPPEDNWWSPGDNGPCGPCSEMFYDMTGNAGNLNKEAFIIGVKKEDIIEIWNDVFMEYEKKDGQIIGKLKQRNVDTGAGLERMTAVMQGKKTAYETDLFLPIIDIIKEYIQDPEYSNRNVRIVADHLRTVMFLITDGVLPSNKDQGYVLRRLIRRAMISAKDIQLKDSDLEKIFCMFQELYNKVYINIDSLGVCSQSDILKTEMNKFRKTLEQGLKEFDKGVDPFVLATTYGFPIELTQELAYGKDLVIDRIKFDQQMKDHQEKSRSASAGMFKGGLANTNQKTTRLHTAHHLLLAALQHILGPSVHQKGSNITEERLRLDFNFDRKITDEEKEKIEKLVNKYIEKDLEVIKRELPKKEAENIGAEMEFGAKYPDIVSIYFIEDEQSNIISKEFCGGPHVTHTKEIGKFKIIKEEAISAGIRRIKAIVE